MNFTDKEREFAVVAVLLFSTALFLCSPLVVYSLIRAIGKLCYSYPP